MSLVEQEIALAEQKAEVALAEQKADVALADQKEKKAEIVQQGIWLGDEAPDFTLESSEGEINWHEYIKGRWALLITFPSDLSPVSTSELGRLGQAAGEFKKRGVRLAALSAESVASHRLWIKDAEELYETKVDFPLLSDTELKVATRYGLLSIAEEKLRTARSAVFVGPDRKVKAIATYPDATGRNVKEILRTIDSLQLTAYRLVGTPADWIHGRECVLLPVVTDDDAKVKFPGKEVRKVRPYLRFIDDPSDDKLAEQVLLQAPPLGPAAAKLTKSQHLLRVGDVVPDFSISSTKGDIKWHRFIEGSWAVLFSHPKAKTPICTTELGRVSQLKTEWEKRGVLVASISTDGVPANEEWIKDIDALSGCATILPILSDAERKVSVLYGMLNQEHLEASGLPLTVRSVFIIGPDKKLKATVIYPASTGRNFDEILRIIDSQQLAAKSPVVTPAEWQPGQPVYVAPSVSTEQARELFPAGVTVSRPYIRSVDL